MHNYSISPGYKNYPRKIHKQTEKKTIHFPLAEAKEKLSDRIRHYTGGGPLM